MIQKPLCIIPARGGSKRLPGKNKALLAGRPLIAYAIGAALESSLFDCVCVSSDDAEILDMAKRHGAHLARGRPTELATDTAQVKDVCLHLLGELAGEGKSYREFAVLLTTNPLRTAEDIRTAYSILQNGDANSVMSLVPYFHPPQRAVWAPDGFVVPYFGGEFMKPTQQLTPLYRHDGSVIFSRVDAFLRERKFYGSKVAPYFIPPERSVDIDGPLDLQWAEFLLGRRS